VELKVFSETGYTSWEGFLWENQIGHEEELKNKKMTNTQRIGLSQVPNRRFTLW
jgi:pre-mRNA-processing factor 8